MTDPRGQLSTPQRAAIAAAVVAVVALVSVLPGVSRPIHRLINVKSDGGEPSYIRLTDDAPFREMAKIIPDDADETYTIQASPDYSFDTYGAGVLYFPPAIPVMHPDDARWIVAFDTEPKIPAALREIRRYRIRANATLVHVEPR